MLATPAPSTTTPKPTDLTTADQSEGDSTTALYRAAIGPINVGYYLPRFIRFEEADRAGLSWNWSAALCTLNWLALRKLWSTALLYTGAVVGLALLVFGIGGLVFQLSESAQWGCLLAFTLAAFALPGLYGNALFHAQCRKRMAHALRTHNTLSEACAMLNREASSRQRLAWLIVANATVVGVVAVGYFSLPKAKPLPDSPSKAAEIRSLALDRALEAATKPLPITSTDPALTPVATASAPLAAVSAPAPAPAASAPLTHTEPKTAETPTQEAIVPTTAAPKAVAIVAKKASPKPLEKPVPKTLAKAPANASTTPKVKTRSPSTEIPTAEPHFFVNAGLFADDNNARNAYVKLSDAGFAAFKQEIKTPKGQRTRVRVGPFDTENEAQTAVEKIRALGLDALVSKPQ